MLVRILICVVCAAIGYFLAGALQPAARSAGSAPAVDEKPRSATKLPSATEDALITEWNQLREKHGTGDMGPLLAAIEEVEDPFRGAVYFAALLGEWVERDPRQALASLERSDYDSEYFFQEWLKHDPTQAIATLLSGDFKADGTLSMMLDDIARLSQDQFVKVVSVLTPSDFQESISPDDVQAAFQTFAKSNPESARAAAEAMPAIIRPTAFLGCAKVLTAKDPEGMLAWVQSLPAGSSRDNAIHAVLETWANADPSGALARLGLFSAPDDSYSSHAEAVLGVTAMRDWDATVKWLAQNKGKAGLRFPAYQVLNDALPRHLALDPKGTLRTLVDSGLEDIDSALRLATFDDYPLPLEAVWAWLDAEPQNDVTESLRISLLSLIDDRTADRALQLLWKLPATPENDTFFSSAASRLADSKSPVQIDALIEEAPAALRPHLLTERLELSVGELISDPASFEARLRELPADSLTQVVIELAGGWVTSDPEGAAAWALARPDEESREYGLGAVIKKWAEAELPEAAAWVTDLPAGIDRDKAISILAGTAGSVAPESAWNWAASIQDAELRKTALHAALSALYRRDPLLAERAVESSNLPESEASYMRALVKKIGEFLPATE